MNNPWLEVKKEISKSVKKITGVDVFSVIEEPLMYGDFALPCFVLSKKMKKAPEEISQVLSEKMKIKYIKEIKAVGPYINFYINWSEFGNKVLKSVNASYGKNNLGKKSKIMVEFSQPNYNKALHMGHARNTIIGQSLCEILKQSDFNVIRATYPGDIGLPIAKTMFELKKIRKIPKKKPDHFIGDLYVKFKKDAEKNPEIEEEARKLLRLWEKGDKEAIKLWKKVRELAKKGIDQTYKRFGTKFDVYIYESQFQDSGKSLVEDALKKGIAFKGDEGQVVANMEPEGLPNFVLLRSDGTSLYQTKELALALYKFKKYKMKRSIYVIGKEQELYLQQVFKFLEMLGYKQSKDCYHLIYDLVMVPGGGKMSAREGNAILLDDFIDEVKKEVKKKTKDDKIAEAIALAAIKYVLIKVSPERSTVFNKNEIIRFEGNTGPYLLYSYARANSILRKKKSKRADAKYLMDKKEHNLLKLLAQYPSVVEKAANEMRPHHIASYAFNLCENFNNFYQTSPVLKANENIMNARLKLVENFQKVLTNCLKLLSIEKVEKM